MHLLMVVLLQMPTSLRNMEKNSAFGIIVARN